ncbi:MAG: metallophosphoesterase [Candidatus Thermoplasmatota archaeon]|nr:metallophosphoesterase [Candidatus Thermoplasmatota archaeon]
MERSEIWNGIFVTDDYCIYVPDEQTVIIADLHLGYEGVLRLQGVAIPKYQEKIIMERLKHIITKYEPETVIVNGDFKHEFGRNLRQEWREVSEVLSFLSEGRKVVLIRGNHDNFLKTIASKFGMTIKWRYDLHGIAIAHGHRSMEEKKMIIAHEHPSIHLRDRVGAMLSLPCYLISDEIIVMPAFSPLASGTDVSSADADDYLSPILRNLNVDINKFKVLAISDIGLLDFSTIEKLKTVRI